MNTFPTIIVFLIPSNSSASLGFIYMPQSMSPIKHFEIIVWHYHHLSILIEERFHNTRCVIIPFRVVFIDMPILFFFFASNVSISITFHPCNLTLFFSGIVTSVALCSRANCLLLADRKAPIHQCTYLLLPIACHIRCFAQRQNHQTAFFRQCPWLMQIPHPHTPSKYSISFEQANSNSILSTFFSDNWIPWVTHQTVGQHYPWFLPFLQVYHNLQGFQQYHSPIFC